MPRGRLPILKLSEFEFMLQPIRSRKAVIDAVDKDCGRKSEKECSSPKYSYPGNQCDAQYLLKHKILIPERWKKFELLFPASRKQATNIGMVQIPVMSWNKAHSCWKLEWIFIGAPFSPKHTKLVFVRNSSRRLQS